MLIKNWFVLPNFILHDFQKSMELKFHQTQAVGQYTKHKLQDSIFIWAEAIKHTTNANTVFSLGFKTCNFNSQHIFLIWGLLPVMTNRLSETDKPMETWRRQIIQGKWWLRASSKARTEDGKSTRQGNWLAGKAGKAGTMFAHKA